MFKRLKNWMNRPSEDHLVASFAWIIGTFAAIGSAVALPTLAPLAVGVATFASLMAVSEWAFGMGGLVVDGCQWAFNKIFKSKKQPVNNQKERSNSDKEDQAGQEKSEDKTKKRPEAEQEKTEDESQKRPEAGQEKPEDEPKKRPEAGQEKPEDENQKRPAPEQGNTGTESPREPQPEQGNPNGQPIILNSQEQLLALMRQMQILIQLLQQTKMELEVLRQKTADPVLETKESGQTKQFEYASALRRPVSRGRRDMHRHFVQNVRSIGN